MKKLNWVYLLFFFLMIPLYAKKFPLSEPEKAWLRKVEAIITLEEIKVFKRQLTTHHQRKAFRDLFWAKRDPDPHDGINPFKEEFLARYDFVLTHFENKRAKVARSDMSHIFLLLGKPTEKAFRIDLGILGSRYRNRFVQHNPELWIYKNVGLNFKRKQLKIQFVPTSNFGDYISLTDNFTALWLRQLKYRFIFHPEMVRAPALAGAGEDYQNQIDLTAKVLAVPAKPDEEMDRQTVVQTTAEPEATPLEVPSPVAAPIVETPSTPFESPTEPKVTVEETDLMVPSTANVSDEIKNPQTFTTDLPNDLGIMGALSYFRSGNDQSLLLGRIGFPLESLTFEFNRDQFEAPFVLFYTVEKADGEVLLQEHVDSQIFVPRKETIKANNAYYSKEFALILQESRYRLRAQLTNVRTQKSAYFEKSIEVPFLGVEGPHMTTPALMDPNVNPDFAKFNIQGTAYTLRLSSLYQLGKRIYPVLELINFEAEDVLDLLTIQAIREGEIVRSWGLYPEEVTLTNQRTLLVHPILNSNMLIPGTYLLRFEIKLPNTDLSVSETSLTIEAPQ